MKMLPFIHLQLFRKVEQLPVFPFSKKAIRVFILLIVITFIILPNGFSQSRTLTKANNAFNAGEYFSAIDYYKDAYGSLQDKTNKADILFKMAECYRLINQSIKAEMWYGRAINRGISNTMAYYYMGQMQKMNLKYEEAKESFKKFKELETRLNSIKSEEEFEAFANDLRIVSAFLERTSRAS